MGRGGYNGGGTVIRVWPKPSRKSRGIGVRKGLVDCELERASEFVPRTYVVSADEAKKEKQKKLKSRIKIGTVSAKPIVSLKPKKERLDSDAFSAGTVTTKRGKHAYTIAVEIKRSAKKGSD